MLSPNYQYTEKKQVYLNYDTCRKRNYLYPVFHLLCTALLHSKARLQSGRMGDGCKGSASAECAPQLNANSNAAKWYSDSRAAAAGL